MKKLKVYIKTYGCQMNERDSEHLESLAKLRGHCVVNDERQADVFIANTCSVREAAESKALGKLSRVAYLKRKGFPILAVTGCMAQNLGGEIIKRVPKIDVIAGTRKMPYIFDYIEEIAARRLAGNIPPEPQKGERRKWKFNDAIVEISDDENSHKLVNLHTPQKSAVCAGISIMQGCAMKCSYCIVPKTRGLERSRPIEDIVKEAEILAAGGTREILLLGQVVNAYGRGSLEIKDKKSPFVQLLEALHEIDKIRRIRFVSPHPSFFRSDLIECYGRLPKLCEYAHLPLQSGSDEILRRMRRPYTARRFLEIASALRAQNPDFSISTDVIVGYPGETEADFQKTCEVFEKSDFDMAYIFKYSPRAGTASAELCDDVSEEQKERRNQILLEMLARQSLRYNEKMIGKTCEVLVEGPAKRGAGNLIGRTRTHKKVVFKAPADLIGSFQNVEILAAGVSALDGVLR